LTSTPDDQLLFNPFFSTFFYTSKNHLFIFKTAQFQKLNESLVKPPDYWASRY